MYKINELILDEDAILPITSRQNLPANIYVNDNADPKAGIKDLYNALGSGKGYDVAIWNGMADNVSQTTRSAWDNLARLRSERWPEFGFKFPSSVIIESLGKNFSALAQNELILSDSAYDPLKEVKSLCAAFEHHWPDQYTIEGGNITKTLSRRLFIHADGWSDNYFEKNSTYPPKDKFSPRTLMTLSGQATIFFDRSQVDCKTLRHSSPDFKVQSPALWQMQTWSIAMFAGIGSGIPFPVHSSPASREKKDQKRVVLFGSLKPEID